MIGITVPKDPHERLPLIQEHIRNWRFLATSYAERRWTQECKCSWDELVELVARLTPADCQGINLSTNEEFPDELVDLYVMKIPLVKKNRGRAVWFEFVLGDDYVKVVSAHRTTLKRNDEV